MAKKPHLPSIFWCAVGFSAAGRGVGSLVGSVLHSRFYVQLPPRQGTGHEQLMSVYGGTYWGILIGIGVGMLVGILYAVLVRRKRRKMQSE